MIVPASTPPSAIPPAGQPPRQPIRRPASVRDGDLPRWATLPPIARVGITLDRVVRAVAGRPSRRPGESGIGELLSSLSRVPVNGSPAAVLVPLFEERGEARVVLTVRSDRLRSHRGEVAFPGGRLDPFEGVVDGALREAHEEVGLDPSSVGVIGHLTSMPTVSSNTVMTPVVGTLAARPVLMASPEEVDRVFDVALADLAADGAFHEEWWSVPEGPGLAGRPGGDLPVWFFDVAGETVWGATARILVELLCLVFDVGDPFAL